MPDFANIAVDAWGDFIEEKVKAGWTPFLLTFMFEPLAGRRSSKMSQLEREIERAYGIFVTRIVRNAKSASQQDRLPIWLCCPDLPVAKRDKAKKQSIRDVIVNDGLHYHVFLLLPPWTRIWDIEGHFIDCHRAYRATGAISRIDVQLISDHYRYVAGYVFKSSLKARFDIGDNFVLPRVRSELHR